MKKKRWERWERWRGCGGEDWGWEDYAKLSSTIGVVRVAIAGVDGLNMDKLKQCLGLSLTSEPCEGVMQDPRFKYRLVG